MRVSALFRTSGATGGPSAFQGFESYPLKDSFSTFYGEYLNIPVRVLSVEDLVMVKLVAGRTKDKLDLPLLAERAEPEALVSRFNVVSRWHGDRAAAMSFADAFVDFLVEYKGMDARECIDKLSLPDYVKEMLVEARCPTDKDDDDVSRFST